MGGFRESVSCPTQSYPANISCREDSRPGRSGVRRTVAGLGATSQGRFPRQGSLSEDQQTYQIGHESTPRPKDVVSKQVQLHVQRNRELYRSPREMEPITRLRLPIISVSAFRPYSKMLV